MGNTDCWVSIFNTYCPTVIRYRNLLTVQCGISNITLVILLYVKRNVNFVRIYTSDNSDVAEVPKNKKIDTSELLLAQNLGLAQP